MSRLSSLPGRAGVALAISVALTAVVACDEEGKTAPERCSDPLPLFDPATAGVPADHHPCVTPIGDAVSYVGSAGPSPSSAGAGSSNAAVGGAGGEGGAGN